MKEVILTASVLILALILFRFLFRNTIPRRVQYALWALVLARRREGISMKEAARQVAADTGLSKKALYDAAIKA